MAVAFANLPDETRMAIRDIITKHGGEVEGYNGPLITVAAPRQRAALYQALDAAGLQFNNCWYFPLGGDKPFEELRHDGSYAGSRGFRLFVNFRVK